MELSGVGVLSAQVLCCCFGWELRFAHVAEIPGQVDGFTYKQERLTSCINPCVKGNIFYSSFRHFTDMAHGTAVLSFLSHHPRALSTFGSRAGAELPLKVSCTHL